MKNIVFLNGPPGSGKDHMARVLDNRFGFLVEKFSQPITDAIGGMFDIGATEMAPLRGSLKDVPRDEFNDLTPREVWIDFSERFAKPLFGKSVFGRLAARKVNLSVAERIVFSDCGFLPEVNTVCKYTGCKALLIRLHREGCSFAGDSRSYLNDEELLCESLEFYNRGEHDDERRIVSVVRGWMKK